MRAYTPGGRFDATFEKLSLEAGIAADLRNPIGSYVDWWVYDSVNSSIDSIYDTGSVATGLVWNGPVRVPVIRALISQGDVDQSERGYYNVDTLHLTILGTDIQKADPGILANPSDETRARVIWHNEVWRPRGIQQRGIIGEAFSLVTMDLMQVSAEELVNESQFAAYAQ